MRLWENGFEDVEDSGFDENEGKVERVVIGRECVDFQFGEFE